MTAGDDVLSVSDAGVVTLLKPGQATITVSLPGTENYNAAASKTIAVTVEKGDAPKTKPSSTMSVGYSVDKVSAVSLPAGWTWAEADKGKTLTVGSPIIATAEYTAADKDYYTGGKTASVTITRQSKPSDSGNSGGSSDSSSSGSSDNTGMQSGSVIPVPTVPASSVLPVIPAVNNPVPASQIPVTDISPEKPAADPGKPFIEGHPDQDGWDVIKDKLQDAISDRLSNPDAGGVVTVDMNGASVVPGDVLDEIRGQDVSVVFDLGDGIRWTVNGMDITGDDIGDIDFAVSAGTNAIPVDVVNNVTGERYSIQISLAHDGEFGFTATLSINMDARNAGLFANLFYYNKANDELEFICADEISEDGTADLTFTHASDYTIVVDKEPMDGSALQSDVLADAAGAGTLGQSGEGQSGVDAGFGTRGSGTDEAVIDTATDKASRLPWWVIALCGGIIAIGLGGVCVIKIKK